MSTTWKSLAAGFAAGVVSTAATFVSIKLAVVLWVASLGYLAYKRFFD